MRHLVLVALIATAPAYAAGPAQAAEAVVYGPIDRPVLHLSAADMGALLPDDHEGLVELQKLYAEFVDDVLGDNEDANIALLTTAKPAELDILTAKGMEIVAAKGHDAPAAAVFVLASARLAYSDLAYSMRPTPRMKEKQAAAFWKVLHTEVWPGFVPVDLEARAYLHSIIVGAREGSPWREQAQALTDRMDAAGRGVPEATPATP